MLSLCIQEVPFDYGHAKVSRNMAKKEDSCTIVPISRILLAVHIYSTIWSINTQSKLLKPDFQEKIRAFGHTLLNRKSSPAIKFQQSC